MASKIIVLGSTNGHFASAFKKLGSLHAKNRFSFAIVTGNLFGEDEGALSGLLNGEVEVPLTTYFTVGKSPLPPRVVEKIEKDEDICENLHYLGKRSITTTAEGIRIVTLGGALDSKIVAGQSQEQHLPYHTPGDATALRGANKADILLTSIWPAAVWSNAKATLSPENQAALTVSQEVADLCSAIKPRYHFSCSPGDFFYEREPFFYPSAEDDASGKIVTRFLSMAPFGNPAKAKAMYAFNLTPGEIATTIPPGSTVSPFLPRGTKRGLQSAGEGYPSRFANGDSYRGSSHNKRRREPPPDPSRCFFCLSNRDLETHMISAIGDHSYLAAAKGPLPASDFYASVGLDFPGHKIIVPLPHEPTMRRIEEQGALDGGEGEGIKTFNEMARFRDAIQAMVAAQSNHKLGTVTWEISRGRNIHHHWQILPVNIDLLRKDLVEAAFKVEAENLQYPPLEARTVGPSVNDDHGDFFRLWLWSDDGEAVKGKELVMKIDDSFRFDLQFARGVLAKLLQLEPRMRWQDVTQTAEEETADKDRFLKAFAPYNFAA